MRRRYLIFVGAGTLLATAAALSCPRLNPGQVLVTRSEDRGDEMVVEYRMSRPFEVVLRHGIRTPIHWPDGPGVHLGSCTSLRKQTAAFIGSSYDLLRGEHYVRVRFRRGAWLSIEGNGCRFQLSPWLVPDAGAVKWLPPSAGVRYGDGVGNDVLHFAASQEQEEYLIAYAGTAVQRSVE